MDPKVLAISSHILQQLQMHRTKVDIPSAPLFVAVQGPQGSGKTYLTSRVRDALTSPPHSLSVAVLSIDDLYLPHDGLVAVAQKYPQNGLLKGRGQPGTHDVELGTRILTQLKHINASHEPVHIPSFDKSLFSGEGDRVDTGTVVSPPVDVVILEGWCVGFYLTTSEEINRWKVSVVGLEDNFLDKRGFRREDVLHINGRLKEYPRWWSFFDTFIQIEPEDGHQYDYVYKWRLQQEHDMKAKNGGKGMTDEQVESFVDRYIPGYMFFAQGIRTGSVGTNGEHQTPPWLGKSLCIQIGKGREIVQITNF